MAYDEQTPQRQAAARLWELHGEHGRGRLFDTLLAEHGVGDDADLLTACLFAYRTGDRSIEAFPGALDVLDALFGAGTRSAGRERRPALPSAQQRLLEAIAESGDTHDALARAGLDADQGLAVLARLEVDGYVRRGSGGRFEVVP